MGQSDMRIGQGFDVHAFQLGRRLVLGGVEIPCDVGLAGHSDADVLTHAICDALLGAIGKGDIGRHFPDDDARFKDADSVDLLREVMRFVVDEGWHIVNIDVTVMAQKPRISPYTDAMCDVLADVLAIPVSQLNIKATTTEHLGFTGREEGMAAMAVVLLKNAE